MACKDATVSGYVVGSVRDRGDAVEFTLRIPSQAGTPDDLTVRCAGDTLADNVADTLTNGMSLVCKGNLAFHQGGVTLNAVIVGVDLRFGTAMWRRNPVE